MSNEIIITREETFAPVVGLYEFGTEEEASSLPKACREAGESQALEVGMAGVNLSLLSACETSFGGVKKSGYGREGPGVEKYLAVKSILINVANG